MRLELEGLPARIAQHELDHLDGVLILDRTTPEARREALAPAAPAADPRSARCGWPSPRPLRSAPTCSSGSPPSTRSRTCSPGPTGRSGRGRKVGAAAGEGDAPSGSGSRCASRSGSTSFEPGVDTVVVAAYGVLIPEAVLDRALWLNVHPSLLPRWRGAAPIERALMAGDERDGRDDHRARAGARRRADRRAAGVPDRRRRTTSAPSRRAPASWPPSCSRRRCPSRRCGPSPRRASPTRRRSAPRTASSTGAARRRSSSTGFARSRRTSARAASCTDGRSTVWRARIEGGELVPVEVQPDGRQADGLRRVPARPALSVSPARRAAFETIRRVFEDDAYADRAFRGCGRGRRPARAGARAAARLRDDPARPHARPRDRGSSAAARSRRLDPPVQAALRLGAYQLAYSEVAVHAAVNESVELVAPRGLERAVKFTNAVLRRLTLGLRELVEALPEETPEQAALRHSYPDWVARGLVARPRRRAGAELMRAQNEPPERAVRLNARRRGPVGGGEPDPEIPGALRVERMEDCDLAAGFVWPQSRGSQLAGLAVGAQRRRARARPLRRARREGDAARRERRGGRRGREAPGPRPRAGGELQASRARANVRVVNARRARAPGRPRRVRPRARRRALLRPGRARRAAGPALARASRCPSCSGTCCASPPSACGRAARSSTRSARSTRTRTRRSSTRAASSPSRSARSGRSSRTAQRPEFLLTLPAPRPHLRVLHRPAAIIRRMSWDDWIRTVEVEPSLYAADFSRLGEQVEVLLRAECRVFHFDVGDGHFIPPVTIGPDRAASGSRRSSTARAACSTAT